MKNRLFTIIPTLFLLFSFSAFANLHLTCAIVLESGDEQQASGSTIDVCPNDQVRLQWIEDYYSHNSIGEIEISYGETMSTATDHHIGSTVHQGSSKQDQINWTVPMSIAGDWIYIQIRDISNPVNSYTIACDVNEVARKTGSTIPSPVTLNCAPNPVVNSLRINGSTDNPINSVRLYDIAGNNVAHYEFQKSYNETVDVSALPSGTYVAIINEEKQFKIVKQ